MAGLVGLTMMWTRLHPDNRGNAAAGHHQTANIHRYIAFQTPSPPYRLMSSIPQAARYRPDPVISEIADFIGDPVSAADFPQTRLRFRNNRWADVVGLAGLSDDAWLQHFGRFAPLEGNLPQPLALRYHGHQFRSYNPDIGDGRGFLFAQLRDGATRIN